MMMSSEVTTWSVDTSVLLRALMLTMLGSSGTLVGACLVTLQRRPSPARLGMLQGASAGLMIGISFFDLLPAATEAIGFGAAVASFFAGAAFFAAVSAAFEETPGEPPKPAARATKGADEKKGAAAQLAHQRREAMLSGLLTALGIALHNFPEGIAVYLASLKEARLGLSVGVAIAVHNIPEGLCIALPVYFATGSRWQGLKLAAISGLAEPAGALLVGTLLPQLLSEWMVEAMLATVAGIMTFLSFHELLPLSYATAGKWHVNAAVFAGMALMAATLMMMQATGAE